MSIYLNVEFFWYCYGYLSLVTNLLPVTEQRWSLLKCTKTNLLAKWHISKHNWFVLIECNASHSEWNGWLVKKNTPISPLQETFSNESALILLYHCSFSSSLHLCPTHFILLRQKGHGGGKKRVWGVRWD